MGRRRHQPQRVAPTRHLHRAQPQHPPPAPRGLWRRRRRRVPVPSRHRRRRLPVPPRRQLLPQCGRVPVPLLLLLRRRGLLLPPPRAARRRPGPPRAGARDVPRPTPRRGGRHQRRARGAAQEAVDQEPRVGVPVARAQARPRHPDRDGGDGAAGGQRAAPHQVRAAEGGGGGVGAGEEDPEEGALRDILIDSSRPKQQEQQLQSSYHYHCYHSHSCSSST